jgi:hypothetical protein
MRALSVRQPWAYLIRTGDKRIENRSWPTKHRGDLVIHAGLSRTEYRQMSKEGYDDLPELGDGDFGVLCAIVNVVDCVPVEDVEGQDYAEGPWCFILENPRPIVPVRFTGKLGLFTLPGDVADRLELIG